MIDTHCHLDVPPLGDDPAGVLDRAAARGVMQIVLPAYDRASWPGIVAMATTFAAVHPALGLHPWVAFEEKSENSLTRGSFNIKDQLAAAIENSPVKIVAIGEIGLDTKVSLTDGYAELPSQLPVFEAQLDLAIDLDLPVILHCRGAFEELLAAVARHRGRLRGVVHAYSRGVELADRILAAGLHLGLGGAVTREQSRVRKAVVRLPLDRIVLETDAPSIGLDGVPAHETEPHHVRDVAEAIAGLRGESLEHVAEVTTANACALFDLPV